MSSSINSQLSWQNVLICIQKYIELAEPHFVKPLVSQTCCYDTKNILACWYITKEEHDKKGVFKAMNINVMLFIATATIIIAFARIM